MSCAACWPEDAQAAWEADKALAPVSVLVDESHFRVTLRACEACSQRFVCVFAETVDWVDGEDPQSWSRMPVSLEEAVALVGPADAYEGRLYALGAKRKSLRRDFPKGAAEPKAFWTESFTIGPHD